MFWYWSHIRRYDPRFNHITILILHTLLHHFTPLHMQIKKCGLRSHRHEFSITFSIWVLESLAAWADAMGKHLSNIQYQYDKCMYTYLKHLKKSSNRDAHILSLLQLHSLRLHSIFYITTTWLQKLLILCPNYYYDYTNHSCVNLGLNQTKSRLLNLECLWLVQHCYHWKNGHQVNSGCMHLRV